MRPVVLAAFTLLPHSALATEPSPPPVAGTWAQLQYQTSIATIPVAGDVVSHTVAILRVVIDQDSTQLKVQNTPCLIAVDSEVEMVRTIVPPAMLRAIGTQRFRARLQRQGNQWTYYQPPTMQTLGVNLNDNWKDKMPTDAKDPRVVDADGDGKPGVTVRVEGIIEGAVYVVQRSWSRLEGVITQKRIKGSLTWQTDQTVLDATSIWLESSPKTRPSARPADNFFRAIQVAPDATCDDILKIPRSEFDF